MPIAAVMQVPHEATNFGHRRGVRAPQRAASMAICHAPAGTWPIAVRSRAPSSHPAE